MNSIPRVSVTPNSPIIPNTNLTNNTQPMTKQQIVIKTNQIQEHDDQNPFKRNNSNPFGDNFSMLNDNDIFGLEFDRIRQNNEKSSNNNLTDQGNHEFNDTMFIELCLRQGFLFDLIKYLFS